MKELHSDILGDLGPALEKAGAIFLEMVRGNLTLNRITPATPPSEIQESFAHSLGGQGRGLISALEDFENLVLPQSLQISNPMYMGLVNSSPLPGAALMDSLVSALDNNAGASHQGPAGQACEAEVIRSLLDLLGLAPETKGLFLPGGTFANLHGLLLARTACRNRHRASYDRMTLYYSEASHFSIGRAAQVMGLEPENLRMVPVKGRGHIDILALDARISDDKAAGLIPCAVTCNLGTTGTGALDPIQEVIEVCRDHNTWCHVDACIGGSVMMLEEFAEYRRALVQADSLAVDLHKWFFMPLTASLVLTRHAQVEADCFQLEASYIPRSELEPYQRGIPTSRRESGLTVWLAIRAYGWEIVARTVRENIRLTRLLEEKLSEAGFQVLQNGELSVCCARMDADDLPPGFHECVAENIRKQGEGWFGTVRHGGHVWWRFNILNLYAEEAHVLRMVELLIKEVFGLIGRNGEGTESPA